MYVGAAPNSKTSCPPPISTDGLPLTIDRRQIIQRSQIAGNRDGPGGVRSPGGELWTLRSLTKSRTYSLAFVVVSRRAIR